MKIRSQLLLSSLLISLLAVATVGIRRAHAATTITVTGNLKASGGR